MNVCDVGKSHSKQMNHQPILQTCRILASNVPTNIPGGGKMCAGSPRFYGRT